MYQFDQHLRLAPKTTDALFLRGLPTSIDIRDSHSATQLYQDGDLIKLELSNQRGSRVAI